LRPPPIFQASEASVEKLSARRSPAKRSEAWGEGWANQKQNKVKIIVHNAQKVQSDRRFSPFLPSFWRHSGKTVRKHGFFFVF